MNSNTERTPFAERLRMLRKEKGLNAKDAAEQMGISYQNYRKYETKIYPSHETTVKIADFYGVTVDYLMGRTDECHSYNDSVNRFVLHQKRKNYGVVENDLGSLSEFEIRAVKKIRSVSSEKKAIIAEFLMNLKDIDTDDEQQ